MNAILEFLRHPIADAVGAALLHFVWQGALAAGLLALALYLFGNLGANARYALCVSAMLLMFLLPVGTALQIYFSSPVSVQVEAILPAPDAVDARSTTEPIQQNEASTGSSEPADPALAVPGTGKRLMQSIEAETHKWRQLMVVCWITGLVFFSLRLAGGFLTLRRLRKSALPLADSVLRGDDIDALFTSLMSRMGIHTPVSLCTSSRIRQPLLIGWLKPMVLLPASLLTGLPPDQLEAILAHELAHVRRHDYLVLLAQSVMETLFFYHPAVWWVSERMRVEREYCCDEDAVAVSDKMIYVRALTNLEAAKMRFALAAGGGRLLDRIQRLLETGSRSRGSRLMRTSWSALLVLLIGGSMLFIACERTIKEDDLPADVAFEKAVERARGGDYAEAERLAEQAAEKGNLCAMQLLTEITYPRIGPTSVERNLTLPAVEWEGQSEEKTRKWIKVFHDALLVEAELGNDEAMLWLARIYHPSYFGYLRLDVIEQNKDESMNWYERAAVTNAQAKFEYATWMRRENRPEAVRLFREAALMGDGRAFRQWADLSGDLFVDPRPYFEVASIAIDSAAEGIHDWFGKNLEELQKQVGRGDPGAIEWMAIVDSLQLIERLSQLPDSRVPVYPNIPLCPIKHWRYP